MISTCIDGSPCLILNKVYSNSPAPIPETTPESSFLDIIRKKS